MRCCDEPPPEPARTRERTGTIPLITLPSGRRGGGVGWIVPVGAQRGLVQVIRLSRQQNRSVERRSKSHCEKCRLRFKLTVIVGFRKRSRWAGAVLTQGRNRVLPPAETETKIMTKEQKIIRKVGLLELGKRHRQLDRSQAQRDLDRARQGDGYAIAATLVSSAQI